MYEIPKHFDRERKKYFTGYWGVWSTNSNRFCFGVQAATKKEALNFIRKKTMLPVKRTQFRVKGINERHHQHFRKPLKWRNEFVDYKKENEDFKRTNYIITERDRLKRIESDVYEAFRKFKEERGIQ